MDTAEVRPLPRGRIDRQQQSVVIKLEPIKARINELEEMWRQTRMSADEFATAVNLVAEESGLLASVVRKYVLARVADKVAAERRKCEQLSLLFDDDVGA